MDMGTGLFTDTCLECWVSSLPTSLCTSCNRTLPLAYFKQKLDRPGDIKVRYQCKLCEGADPVRLEALLMRDGLPASKVHQYGTYNAYKSSGRTDHPTLYRFLVARCLRKYTPWLESQFWWFEVYEHMTVKQFQREYKPAQDKIALDLLERHMNLLHTLLEI